MVKTPSITINMTVKNASYNSFLSSATAISNGDQDDQEVPLQSKLMQQTSIMSLLTKYITISTKLNLSILVTLE